MSKKAKAAEVKSTPIERVLSAKQTKRLLIESKQRKDQVPSGIIESTIISTYSYEQMK